MRKLLFLCLLCLCLPSLAFAADDEEEEKPKPVPLYHQLEQPLVTNLVGGPKFIRAEVQFMYYQPEEVEYESKDLLTKHSPALRHEMLLLLIDQDGKALKTPAGKEKLRKTAVKALRKLMEEKTGQPVIEDLFFTSYYVR
jgi:flagellar FliL protein